MRKERCSDKKDIPMHGRHLLLVEDDFYFRLVMAEALADEGFTVVEAENGDVAVVMLEHLDRLDMLVTDIQMPGRLDGNCVAKEAKRLHPDLPVLYMSGYSGSLTNIIGPTDAFLCKPFKSRHMIAEIARLLAVPVPL
jgi:CheY-like chemotaxis protein